MNTLENIDKIKKLDKSNMLKILLDFPQQCKDAVSLGSSFYGPYEFKDCQEIIFAGVGGSAIGADLIRTYLSTETQVPILVNRDYNLPSFVNNKTLVFACSYSGNTEETLEGYEDAKTKRAKLIVMTSGGKLMDQAKKDGIPAIALPPGNIPRCALGYSFFTLLCVLSDLRFVKFDDNNTNEAIEKMESMIKEILAPEIPPPLNVAKAMAIKLHGKFPVIYAANKYFDAVVLRWRGQLAENSKTLSSSHVFPEMTHNEIVGWNNPKTLLSKLAVILLRDASEHPRVSKRIDITKGMIAEASPDVFEINSSGLGLLARMFSLICIGDFVSFYLAVLNNVDPTPVDRITYLKSQLAKE